MQKLLSACLLFLASLLPAAENEPNIEHYFRENKALYFHYYSPGKAAVRLEFYGQLPEDDLIQENRERFRQSVRIATDGTPYQVYSLDVSLSDDDSLQLVSESCEREMMKYTEDGKSLLPVHLTYGVGRSNPLKGRPQQIAFDGAKNLLENKKCLIVVGTGVAEHAGVATRAHFAAQIGMNEELVDGSVRSFLSNPKSLLEAYVDRSERGLFGQPTPTIEALAKLSTKLQAPIFTCNFDQLIQKTQTPVINLLGGRTEAIERLLETADVVLTIGLKRDPEEVLSYFKSTHPDKVILALDLDEPDYLGSQDFLLRMDLTDAIPKLVEEAPQKSK